MARPEIDAATIQERISHRCCCCGEYPSDSGVPAAVYGNCRETMICETCLRTLLAMASGDSNG
jgi:hypothetical protein